SPTEISERTFGPTAMTSPLISRELVSFGVSMIEERVSGSIFTRIRSFLGVICIGVLAPAGLAEKKLVEIAGIGPVAHPVGKREVRLHPDFAALVPIAPTECVVLAPIEAVMRAVVEQVDALAVMRPV